MSHPDSRSGRSDWPRDCPHPPAAEKDLDFCRQPMVDWLAPGQLAATGVKAVVSSVFGAYADKREIQAALHPAEDGEELYVEDYSGASPDEPFWLDYAADLGDGFDSTYALAWLLSRPELAVEGVDGKLPRGRALVLGGDQVYPTANREEYQDRFAGPYRAAFPWISEPQAPHLFAIPGNHDWYDGLTSFTRLFCQKRWIGGWKTRQKRSYFALKLPHGWWLWGTDIQLEADIDLPQMEFFHKVAREMHREAREAGRERPRLILCTAQPEWVYSDVQPPGVRQPPRRGCRLPVDPERYESLEYFHREVIARHDIELAAMFSGDLHHYTRYERAQDPSRHEAPVQLITCGGGGAYLYPTHHMPEALSLACSHRTEEGNVERDHLRYEQRAVFPEAEDSRRLGRWSWLSLPRRNWRFAGLLSAVYVLFAWVIQSASKSINGLFADWWPGYAELHGLAETVPASLMDALSRLEPGHFPKVVHAFWDVMRHSPSGLVLALVVVFGLWKYRQSGGSPGDRGVAGVVHGLAHLLLAFWLIWVFSWVNLKYFGWHVDDPLQVVLFAVEMLLAGGFLGGWLFGIYLMVTSKLSGAHINDVFSSQSLTSYKSFLRLKIDPDGRLTVYSVGVPQVPRGKAWSYRGDDPDLGPGDPWIAPPDDGIATRLVEEEPIEL